MYNLTEILTDKRIGEIVESGNPFWGVQDIKRC